MYEWIFAMAIVCVALGLEHFWLWEYRLHRVVRYVIGTLALLVSQSLGLHLRGVQLSEIVGIWAVAGVGGLIVGGLHVWRQQRGEEPGEVESAFLAGALARKARDRRESP